MSTRLDLPPERDLPEPRRRAIRAELVRTSRVPTRRRRPWLLVLPAAALATVLAVVLGLTGPGQPAPPVIGVPSASPSTTATPSDPTPRPTRSPAPAPAIPAARSTDRGPLGATARMKAISRCLADLDRRTGVAEVHLARRTSTAGDVVLFTGRDGQSYACSSGGASVYAGSGSKTTPLPAPSRRRPVVRILAPGAGGSRSQDGSASSETEAYYRVGPEVASLQLRLTVQGHTGPWFEASTDGGYAWAAARVEYTTATHGALPHDFTVDDRAFDAAGRPLAIDRTSR